MTIQVLFTLCNRFCSSCTSGKKENIRHAYHHTTTMKHFFPDGSGLFLDDPAPIHRAWRSLSGLISITMMEIIHYGLRRCQISTQSNSYGRFCSAMLDTTIIETLNKENLFTRMAFISPVYLQRLGESMPSCIEAVLAARVGPTACRDTVWCFGYFLLI